MVLGVVIRRPCRDLDTMKTHFLKLKGMLSRTENYIIGHAGVGVGLETPTPPPIG